MKKTFVKAISIVMCLVTICTSLFISPISASAARHLCGDSGYLTGDESYYLKRFDLEYTEEYRLDFHSDVDMHIRIYNNPQSKPLYDEITKSMSFDFWTSVLWVEIEMDLNSSDTRKYNFGFSILDVAEYATTIRYAKEEYVFFVNQKPEGIYYSTNGARPRSITIKSSDPKLVKVVNNRLVRGDKKEGSCIITATLDNGASASTKVTFTYATGIKLQRKNITLHSRNGGFSIPYKTSPVGYDQREQDIDVAKRFQFPAKDLKWKSTNTKVAKVDSEGCVVATGLGHCKVYAILNKDVRRHCNIHVPDLSAITFTNSTYSLPTINGQKVTNWKSGNKSIVKVSGDKMVFKSDGGTSLKVKYNGEEYKYFVTCLSEDVFKKKAVSKFLRNGKRKKSQIKEIWRGIDDNYIPTVLIKYSVKENGKTKYKYYRYIYCAYDGVDYLKGEYSYRGKGAWSNRPKLHESRKLKV